MTEIELEINKETVETDEIEPNTDGNTATMHRKTSTIGLVEFKEKDEHAVVFQNVSYSINKFSKNAPFGEKVEILHDASGYIPSNCLCGIIGASGAGKTTLLGLLAGIPKSGKKTGHVGVSSKKIAFVSQRPHISETETVYEILQFSCSVTYKKLMMSTEENESLSRWKIISDKITSVLSTLNLNKVRNRQIKYLSGGELKRVSIAIAIVQDVDILILDEPTSGLDTPNALSIVQTLRRIVEGHKCTIIMSIHQPHKRICDCMDWIISLKNGLLLYMGPLGDAFKCRDILLNEIISKLDYDSININVNTSERTDTTDTNVKNSKELESTSMDNKLVTNEPLIAGDYFDILLIKNLNNLYNIDVIDKENNVNYNLLKKLINDIISDGHNTGNAADYLLETEYLSNINKLHNTWIIYRDNKYKSFNNKVMESLSNNLDLENKLCGLCCDINNIFGCDVTDYCNSFLKCNTYISAFWAFIGLSLRTLRYYYRKWWIFVFNIIISVCAGFILGSIYGKMGFEQDDIQNRFGAFGFICIFIGIQAIAASGTFHQVRDVFIDDRNGKLYGATPFLFARILPDLCLLRIIPSILFAFILFQMLGLQQHTQLDFILVVILLSCASTLCVFAISSLMPDAYIASFVAIFINMLFMLYGGVFVQDESTIPAWVEWPKELSFYNFAFEILMVNEFKDLVFKIDSATITIGGTEIYYDADKAEVTLSGDFFLGFFGMIEDDVPYDWTMLILWCAIYIFIAWISLELFYRSRR